jgi:hypothetical protein
MDVCDRPTDPRRYWHCFTLEQWDAFTVDEYFAFLLYPFDEWVVGETAIASVCLYRSDQYPRANPAAVFDHVGASTYTENTADVFAGEGRSGSYIVSKDTP